MPTDSALHVLLIDNNLPAQLQRIRADLVGEALNRLQVDIRDPSLNDESSPEFHPDGFMLRANEIGRALIETGHLSLALALYDALLTETRRYREETGEWRHAGALHANKATAMWFQGNIDQMVIELLNAADEDRQTYRSEHEDSPAINQLLRKYLVEPVLYQVLATVKAVDPTLAMADVESSYRSLGGAGYAFLAYIYLVNLHQKGNSRFPNIFSQLQIFGALRSLSSLLEVRLKTIAHHEDPGFDMNRSLDSTLNALYSDRAWWKSFNKMRESVGAVRNRRKPIDTQLRRTISINVKSDDERFQKSLLMAYIVRNYTIHHLETQGELVQSYAGEALGHLLYVITTAPRH